VLLRRRRATNLAWIKLRIQHRKQEPCAGENPSAGERRGQGRQGRCVTGEKAAEKVDDGWEVVTVASCRAVVSPREYAMRSDVASPRVTRLESGRTRVHLYFGPRRGEKARIDLFSFRAVSNRTVIPGPTWFRTGPCQSGWIRSRSEPFRAKTNEP
jgi:hypothetical protein